MLSPEAKTLEFPSIRLAGAYLLSRNQRLRKVRDIDTVAQARRQPELLLNKSRHAVMIGGRRILIVDSNSRP